MSNKLTNIIAICLLLFVFIITIASIKNESLTMDESAHLPAGYSYLTQKDMRLNPEHPPLIKDLSAIPLLFIKDIKFPSEIKDWKEDVNGQWGFGNYFLFKTGNPADEMIFWARIPMILLLIILGFYVFLWARQLFGNNGAILSLLFFSLSPTLLAHGRLVTTDVGAATGAFISTYYFVKFLQNNTKKNLLLAGITLGIAQLFKFSLVLLFPFMGILIFVLAIVKTNNFRAFLKLFGRYLLLFILMLIIAYILIWFVYLYHTWNYPPEKQVSDTKFTLTSFSNRGLADLVVWMADKPLLRPVAQYLLGLFMVLQRTSGGNTGYYMGEVSAAGWKSYFPMVYLLKEPLAFHILAWLTQLLGFLAFLWLTLKYSFWKKPVFHIKNWMKNFFPVFAMILYTWIYWAASLESNLNIGVRHLLPIFPFTIILISGALIYFWFKPPYLKLKVLLVSAFLLWQAISVISVYPHFLSYFNELAGGPENGYKFVTDSNYDWGQDLKWLVKWADDNKVDKIYVDYFGGADPSYYLKDKYISWNGKNDPKELPKGSYLAVSATLLQGGRGKPAPSFNEPTGYYLWLNNYEPVARAGYSIFIYHIE